MMTAIYPGSWELASLFCKFFLYVGAASVAGGSLCLWQFSDGRRKSVQRNLLYMMFGALVGFQAELCNFFIQVGQVSGTGIAGMFDWDMAAILLDTSIGEVTFYRMGAFVWALLATLFYLRKLRYARAPFTQAEYQDLLIVYAAPLLILAFTFKITGHVSVLPVAAQTAIVLHFAAFSLWIGALYPLLLLSRSTDLNILRTRMKRFGDFATGIVLVLFGAGIYLVFQLFNSWQELVTTAYGIGLLTKLFFVLQLLAIAAINRLFLVPRLVATDGVSVLQRSLRREMLVASLVLAVTAYFSTLAGPVE